MKRVFGREILLLTLPLLILGGVAFLKSQKGSVLGWSTPEPFYSGPLQVANSNFEPVEIQPAEAYSGYDWAAKTTTWTKGQTSLPANFKAVGDSISLTSDTRIVYRKGKTWHNITFNTTKTPFIGLLIGIGGMNRELTLRIDLKEVPREAEEIRLRGAIQVQKNFNGVWPAITKPPKGLTIYKNFVTLDVLSKPFDLLIKGPSETWPNPVVSHDPGMEFIRAFHVLDDAGNKSICLQLRRHSNDLSRQDNAPNLISYRLLDANNHKVDVCNANGGSRYYPGSFGTINRSVLVEDFPETDMMVSVWSFVEPCKNQKNIKLPLSLNIEFSDDGKWPFKVKVPIDANKYYSYGRYPFR